MHKLFYHLRSRYTPPRRDQRGLVTMELIILIILAVIIYFIYKRVAQSQH